MTVYIMHQTVCEHDAIGNDIEAEFDILKESAECFVYCENKYNQNVKYTTREELSQKNQDDNTVIIYHHSNFWQDGYDLLKNARCKILFKYHNITPSVFFKGFDYVAFKKCEDGRKQTLDFINNFPSAFWICDSAYNATDISGVSEGRMAVAAPFHKTEKWIKTTPDESILKSLIESPQLNLLFVSRIAPNKGHLQLLDIVRMYNATYTRKVKLKIVGKFDNSLRSYNTLITDKIEFYNLQSYIEFIGEVNDSALLSYYLGSDFYISASEHEGFSVPVVEAQFLGLPVIALDSTAVPETLGKGQILLGSDPREFAAAIHILSENMEYKEQIIKNGIKNATQRFSYEKIKKDFISAFEAGVKMQ